MDELEKEIKGYHILGLLLARGKGGSYENRCLWKIADKSMLQWVLGNAIASRYIEKVVVGSESEEIRAIAAETGALGIARPLEQAFDYPRDFRQGKFKRIKPRSLVHKRYKGLNDSVTYVLNQLKKREGYVADLIVRLSAELPLMKTESIDRLIEAFFRDPLADRGIMIYPVPPKYFFINEMTDRVFPLWIDCMHGSDRQEYPRIFGPGGIHIDGCPGIATSFGRKIVHIIIDEEQGLHVHDEKDLFIANCYMKRRLENEKDKS